MVNEAAFLAARSSGDTVGLPELVEAVQRTRWVDEGERESVCAGKSVFVWGCLVEAVQRTRWVQQPRVCVWALWGVARAAVPPPSMLHHPLVHQNPPPPLLFCRYGVNGGGGSVGLDLAGRLRGLLVDMMGSGKAVRTQPYGS